MTKFIASDLCSSSYIRGGARKVLISKERHFNLIGSVVVRNRFLECIRAQAYFSEVK